MGTLIQIGFESGVGRITINRPEKRNALNRDMIQQLDAETSRLRADCDLRVLVLEATGPVFCAGMDLGEMQQRAAASDGPQEWRRDSEIYSQLLCNLFSASVPTVVKLQGPVLAGGVGLVLACDLIIASTESFFSLPEPLRGITASMVTPLLIHRIGAGIAGQLLLSGEKMSVARAHQLGLCYDVVQPDQLDLRVDELVNSILTGSQSALAITKKHLEHCGTNDIIKQIQQSVEVSAEARETADAREGLAAFLEKRKPGWVDVN